MKKKAKLIVGIAYGVMLASLAAFSMLETFVFPSVSGTLSKNSSEDLFNFDSSEQSSEASSSSSGIASSVSSSESSSSSSSSSEQKGATTLSYEEFSYTVSNKKVPYLLVTVNLKKISDLRTRVTTDDSLNYGINITKPFSTLISEAEQEDGQEVLFAINGDFPFWSSSRQGYVIRNGVDYRSAKRSDASNGDLAIYKDGTFEAYSESDVAFASLKSQHGGCYQNWSFGPTLLSDSAIRVTKSQEVSQSTSANQRVGMGYKEDGTLYFLCANTNDGKRSGSSVGLSLYNMAAIFQDLGCSIAYNFDGGGSANLYVKGYSNGGYYMQQSRDLGDIVYVVNS